MSRNTSINSYFRSMSARHVPRYHFAAGTDFGKWKAELLPAVRASLGRMPQRVPLKSEILAEWTEDDLVKQRVVFDVEDGLSAIGYVFRPEGPKGKKYPAILACHGHGPYGKEPVMGNRSTPQLAAEITNLNYDYGLRMAQAGYAVIAIDWRGFGERDDRRKPHYNDVDVNRAHKRDLCNLHYLRATMLGMTVLGMDVHDGMCALDYLTQQDFVDANRIGTMGLSFGGVMAVWMTLCDPRIKAADVICYSDRFSDMGMRDVNTCGSQITPGLYDLCDIPELQGLIAPQPLLVEIGTYDECFKLDSAMSCWKDVERIYEAAGVRDRLELDLFEGGHQWGGNKSLAFFNKWLGSSAVTKLPKRAATKTVWRDIDPDEEQDPADIAENIPFAVGSGGSDAPLPTDNTGSTGSTEDGGEVQDS